MESLMGAAGDNDFDQRLALLQDVFQISQKKAEGIAQKAMQKNLMKMMKDGDMQKMMEGLEGEGGMEGLEGLMGGMGDEAQMTPEQLKPMLESIKEMKDAGALPPEEFENVKKEFKAAFGQSLEDLVKDAESNPEGMTDDEKEMLELLKDFI